MKKIIKCVVVMILLNVVMPTQVALKNKQVIDTYAATEKTNAVQRMLKEINQFRKVSGLKPVVYNESYAQFTQEVSEMNERNGKMQHSSLNTTLVSGDVMAMESLSFGYQPEESIWAYISDNAKTMGHCHSLLVPDKATMGIGLSGAYGSLFVSSSSRDMTIAHKVCKQLNQRPLSEIKAYIWSQPTQQTPGILNKIPSVIYQANIQKLGWQAPAKDMSLSGTVGKNLGIETLRISLINLPVTGGVSYQTYTPKTGWQTPTSNNQIAGTIGQNTSIETLNIRLTGEISQHYDICYRVYSRKYGWLGFAKNGGNAGSVGRGSQIDALQVVLVKKGDKVETKNAFIDQTGKFVS